MKLEKSPKQNVILKSASSILEKIISILHAVENSIESISRNPQIGKLKEFESPHAQNIRMILVNKFHNYQIFYTVKTNTIEIIRVIHSARDLSDLFT